MSAVEGGERTSRARPDTQTRCIPITATRAPPRHLASVTHPPAKHEVDATPHVSAPAVADRDHVGPCFVAARAATPLAPPLARFLDISTPVPVSQYIARLALLVRDYDEAIAWFTNVLGFRLLEDTPMTPEKRWVVVAPPGDGAVSILLARAANAEQLSVAGRQGGGRVFLFLHTDAFEQDYARMRERGVNFIERPRDEDYGRVVVLEDLFGNRWDLVQRHHR